MPTSDKKSIEKVISGTSTKENAQKVVDWLSSSIEGQQYLSDILERDAYFFEQEEKAFFLPSKNQSERIYRKISLKINNSIIKRNVFKIAAVFIPFVVFIGLLFIIEEQVNLFEKNEYNEIHTKRGEKIRLFLHDGSEIFLNADSKIRYPKKFGFGKRKVYLDGEAYFKITSSKTRPFIVQTGKSFISVLGTSFNVNAYSEDNEVKVVLDEGKVLFNAAGNTYSLIPSQKLIFKQKTGETTVWNLTKSINESLWRDDFVVLNDTPLQETLSLLERRYDVSFHVLDDAINHYSFTLTTENMPVDFIIDELQRIAPIKFTKENDTIFVKAN